MTLRQPAGGPGLTPIVVVTHNQLPLTRACLESVRLRAGEPFERNRRLFHEKWAGRSRPPAPAGPPRLSACLIVRDNEGTIRDCLESLRPWVDETVVVDTGSTDRTPEVCEELGARVFRWEWRDDFAAARNESIGHARGEWVFGMDSDDTLPAESGLRLRRLALGGHPQGMLGYVLQVHCPGAAGDVTVVDHVKLFRNRPDLRSEFRIHEQILPAIRRAGGEVAWTDIAVVRSGADRSDEGRRRKLGHDLRILERERRDRPDHPFLLFNFGMTCAEAGRLDEACGHLTRCLEASPPDESHVRKAFALLAAARMQLGDDAAARRVCEEGLDRFPGDPELLFLRAMVLHRQGRLAAADDYRRILHVPLDRCFTSRDAGVTGYKARHDLAIVCEEMGRPGDAAGEWGAILAERPGYGPARSALRRLTAAGPAAP